ncbi:MAG: hypothetical protein EXS35_07900 [Pedosphaera sp.]|nr:hypothetical protein [Pedosphaera sp.]
MSFARLLASGKSLVGLRDSSHRYRVNKQVRLPKFGSPGNPFEAAGEVAGRNPKASPVTSQPRATAARLDVGAVGKKDFGFAVAARAASWLGEWGQKLNPLARRSQPRSSVGGARTPLQTELSLDRVKVVRNDLSDTDFEVRAAAKPKAASAVAETLEPVGAAWNRLTTRFFGDDQR